MRFAKENEFCLLAHVDPLLESLFRSREKTLACGIVGGFKCVVRSIALRGVGGVFALAKIGCFCLSCFKNHWHKARSFVLSIAERLVFRNATGAVGVFFSSL